MSDTRARHTQDQLLDAVRDILWVLDEGLDNLLQPANDGDEGAQARYDKADRAVCRLLDTYMKARLQ